MHADRSVHATSERELLCPSAQPTMDGGRIFGVIRGTVDSPEVGYLDRPIRVTPEVLSTTHPVEADEVFRIAAPCAEHGCVHFSGTRCELARRAVLLLQPVVNRLPPCSIRRDCRWFAERGGAACLRCPQVVTRNFHADPVMIAAAGGPRVGAGRDVNERGVV